MEEAAMVFHGLDPMLRVDFQALEDGSYVLWDQASLSLADCRPVQSASSSLRFCSTLLCNGEVDSENRPSAEFGLFKESKKLARFVRSRAAPAAMRDDCFMVNCSIGEWGEKRARSIATCVPTKKRTPAARERNNKKICSETCA